MEILSNSNVANNVLRHHFGIRNSHRCQCEINVFVVLTNCYSVATSSL